MDTNDLLVIVDMQNDFIDGSLATPGAHELVDKICNKIKNWEGYKCFTLDTHYEDYGETVEGKHIQVPHCIDGTDGWRLNDRIAALKDRHSFTAYKDSFGAALLVDIVKDLDINRVQLVGLCTDICVISNALLIRSEVPHVEVSVDASCCLGTTPKNHREALDIMKQCCIDIINDN